MVNLGDQLADVIDMNDDVVHRQARPFRQRMTLTHFSERIANQLFNLLHRVSAASRQRANFLRDYRKPFSVLACAGRFHSRVQRQNIGLESDGFDHAGDVFDAF